MSKLRDQLEQARAEYRDGQYPGNLAAELLPSGGSTLHWIFRSVLGGAIAAALAIAVLHSSFNSSNSSLPGNVNRHTGHPPVPVATPISFPSKMPLSLPASPFLPATPPVLVSLHPDTFDILNQPPEELGPRLLEQLNLRRISPVRPVEKGPTVPGPTTQGAVG